MFKMNKYVICLFALLLIALSKTCAQTFVAGIVVDENKHPLSGVIVRNIDGSSKKMIGYGKSDDDGSFKIQAKLGDRLEFTSLGYAKQSVTVKKGMERLTVVMKESAVKLKDVVVKAEKVRVNGDTVNYNIGAYASKNDRSLGDVLAKVPGFEVNKSSGEIRYEGNPISKFYIEGVDLLGGKYGLATNNLPQMEIGSVQVMKNHQPIKVLENFSFTDDAAVNVRMKDKAKIRWIGKLGGGVGCNADEALWNIDALVMRLKSDWQTMLTYKTNNIGLDISGETTNLFNLEAEKVDLKQFIELSLPSVPNVSTARKLFNRSHTATANVLKRLNESSQVNFQLVYNNERQLAEGTRATEYFQNDGSEKFTENYKSYRSIDNELYALVKYENNENNAYVRNSLSGNFNWSSQRLTETGTNPHRQHAKLPELELKDDLYVIKRWGKRLVSFYSNNTVKSLPQSLAVDSVSQDVSQQLYMTDTYMKGGVKLGAASLSFTVGVNAAMRRISSDLIGLPDSLGTLNGTSRFGFVNVYASPQASFKLSDFLLDIRIPLNYIYYKYSLDSKSRHRSVAEPGVHLRWNATPVLTVSVDGCMTNSIADLNNFYNTLIMQDYEYLNRGFTGYKVSTNKSLSVNLRYSDALKSLNGLFSLSRTFTTNPYSMTRDFIGNYIILSTMDQRSKGNSWMANMMLNKGFRWWNTQIRIFGNYLDSNEQTVQNGQKIDYCTRMMTILCHVAISPVKAMRLAYDLKYGRSSLDMQSLSTCSTINNWTHTASLTVPMGILELKGTAEYFHNQLATGTFKDMFFADVSLACHTKHLDYTLSVTNILNKTMYFNTQNTILTRTTSSTRLRGREILLSIKYNM